MRKLLSILFLIILIAYTHSQWFVQAVVTQNNLNAVTFVDSVTAYIAGDNETILKTTNSGANWVVLHTGSLNDFSALDFINVNTGFVVGGDWQNSHGLIFKTTNGGINWSGYSIDSGFFMAVHFINPNSGVIGGWGSPPSLIYQTTNAGINWTRIYIDSVTEASDFSFINAYTGWSAGWSRGFHRVMKTTDSGFNWTLIFTGEMFDVLSIYFVNAETGWLTGDRFISKTTNGGYNWFYQIVPYTYGIPELYESYFINSSTGWVVGDAGTILKTTNGGENWGRQSTGFQYWIWDVYFPNENTGWAVGGNGTILKTTNSGGPIGIKSIASEIPERFSLYQNYPNPFNPVTKIKFSIPASPLSSIGEGLGVRLVIYDILGREVATLVNDKLKSGSYEATWDGTNYPSGVYFYKLSAEGFSETKKMVLMK
jgi:photosystem II stability/assembly factor-like uncharacterized protein